MSALPPTGGLEPEVTYDDTEKSVCLVNTNVLHQPNPAVPGNERDARSQHGGGEEVFEVSCSLTSCTTQASLEKDGCFEFISLADVTSYIIGWANVNFQCRQ